MNSTSNCHPKTFNGCSVRVSMLPYPPYSYPCAYNPKFFNVSPSPLFFRLKRRRLGCEFPGFEIEYFNTLAWILNITLVFVPPVDDEFGYKLDDGSFNGIVGMLQRNEIDMSLGLLWVDESRSKVLDFVYRKNFKHSFAIRSPPRIHPERFSLRSPFSTTVWICIFATLFLVISLAWFSNFAPKQQRPSFFKNLEILFAGTTELRSESYSMHYFVLALATRLPIAKLSMVYTSALLISLIPSIVQEFPFNGADSLHQLIAEKKFREIATSAEDNFVTDRNKAGKLPKLENDALEEKNMTLLFQRIRDSPENLFAYDDPFVTKHYGSRDCGVAVFVDEEGPILQMGFAFPKHSALGQRVRELLIERLFMPDIYFERYEVYGQQQCESVPMKHVPFRLINIQEAVYIFIVGSCIATVSFAFERRTLLKCGKQRSL